MWDGKVQRRFYKITITYHITKSEIISIWEEYMASYSLSDIERFINNVSKIIEVHQKKL